jgi:beta-lactamase superfamily II metal-dependent hydrolase
MEQKIVNVDLLKVYRMQGGKKRLVTVLGWGDPIQVGPPQDDKIPVAVKSRTVMPDGSIKAEELACFVGKKAEFIDPPENDVMRYSVVDVQQGDGAVLETPKGAVVFIDGGENQMFARYVATRFPGTSKDRRFKVDAIVVTHGDADHVAGLVNVHASEKHQTAYKRIFIHPERVLHNGLVKRQAGDGKPPSDRSSDTGSEKRKKIPEDPKKDFGKTVTEGDRSYIIDIVDDPTALNASKINAAFLPWIRALADWSKQGKIRMSRLSDKVGSKEFSFLEKEGLNVQVLGPLEKTLTDGRPALPLLREPPEGIPGAEPKEWKSPAGKEPRYSNSHTINGNSVVLRLTYGRIRLLLTGDLNEESENELVRRHQDGKVDLAAEFLKAPHHGSADFSTSFLEKVGPVVSVVSSGDESAGVEYIHPRATLVGDLGKFSRVTRPLVFITELVAFLTTMGYAKLLDKDGRPKGDSFFSFKRESYGIVHLAFNKERMLVFTHSGKRDLKEAYAFKVDATGGVEFEKLRTA